MFVTYILYSNTLKKYYIGYTGANLNERIKKHMSNHKGFTGKQADWKIVYTENYTTKTAAMEREKQLKGWKSKVMIEKLISKQQDSKFYDAK